ncbi:MAG: hypothetical protein M3Q70_01815 [bacterium]|nr:hypothetical protein [bacterium]
MDNNAEKVTPQTETKVVYKEKNRMSNLFTRTLLSFLLILCGVAIVWLWMQWRDARQNLDSANNQISSLNQDKSSLTQQVGALRSGSAEKVAEATEQSVRDEIVAASRAYVLADENADQNANYSYNISKQTDDFARVSVGVPEGSGFYVILKKSSGVWTVVSSGQDAVPEAVAEKYGIPAEMR